MKIQKTNALSFGVCNNEVYLNTYVSSWSGNVELKFNGLRIRRLRVQAECNTPTRQGSCLG